MTYKFSLLGILILAVVLRWYGINWDDGWHLHPDERMLIMVAERITLFSQMNPDFFNYGTLPIYILKGLAQVIAEVTGTTVANYDGLLGVGRGISVGLEIGVIMLIYKTVLLLFRHRKPALFSSIAYAIAFFPIQNSHFFIVDNFLNFFMATIVYLLVSYLKKPHILKVAVFGILIAAAVTTKATGLILLAPVGIALLLPFQKQTLFQYIGSAVLRTVLFGFCFVIFCYLFMPFAFASNIQLNQILIDPITIFNPRLVSDVSLQMKMNSDPFIFPYTLQYVMTTPYLYYLKNMFLWGLGPPLSILSVLGCMLFIWTVIKAYPKKMSIKEIAHKIVTLPTTNSRVLIIVYLLFYLLYFVIIGRSAVKFMRYMLPLYPPLALLAGFALYEILTYYHDKKPTPNQIKIKPYINIGGMVLFIAAGMWSLMFQQIYSKETTRITASKWIYQNIPPGSTVAVEHWDDRLPLPLHESPYTFNELTLYDPDSPEKWTRMNDILRNSDYIIIASNRLYTPLPKLKNCAKLPTHRCYIQTAQYYDRLFKGELGYTKVAEFTSYPTLKLGSFNLEIPDDSADESFTVYDHPKIMIFRNTNL